MKCSECDADMALPEDVMEGEIMTCPDCGSSFEVFKSKEGAFDIRPAEVEGEDWGE